MRRDVIKNLEEYREKTETGQFNESVKLKMDEFFTLIDYTILQRKTEVTMKGVYIKNDMSDYLFELLLNVWNAGYMTGYKKGTRSAREKHITVGQEKEIEALYTPEEIDSMLRRLKKGTLSDITRVQADRMIDKRTC